VPAGLELGGAQGFGPLLRLAAHPGELLHACGEARLDGPQPRQLDVAQPEGGAERRHLAVEIGDARGALAQVRLELSGAHVAPGELAREALVAGLVRVDLLVQIRQQSLEQRAAPLGGLE